MRENPRQDIENQMAWLPHRAPARSPAGLLRRAIEQRWPAPAKLRATEVQGTTGWDFARCFYAAYGGNRGEPVNEPSPREAQFAADFVQRLTRAAGGDASRIDEWGRTLGQLAREQRNPFPSLQLAIRQLGDAFLVKIEKQRLHAQLATVTQLREQHEQTHRAAWLTWLVEQESTMREAQPEEYTRFIARRERERADLAADPKPWSKKVLDSFENDSARLSAFRQFFALPDFWQWDADINNQPFNPIT
jgi:hypothetical protein